MSVNEAPGKVILHLDYTTAKLFDRVRALQRSE